MLCVRASERSCVREMIPLWLAAGAREFVVCPSSSAPPPRHARVTERTVAVWPKAWAPNASMTCRMSTPGILNGNALGRRVKKSHAGPERQKQASAASSHICAGVPARVVPVYVISANAGTWTAAATDGERHDTMIYLDDDQFTTVSGASTDADDSPPGVHDAKARLLLHAGAEKSASPDASHAVFTREPSKLSRTTTSAVDDDQLSTASGTSPSSARGTS